MDKVVIPTYNRQNVKVSTAQAQLDTLPGQAEAKGQAQLAAAQGRLSNTIGQGVAMEARELTSRLNDFSNEINSGIQNTARDIGTANATLDVKDLNTKVMGIRGDSSKSPEDKRAEINVLRQGMGRAYGGIYADAYNSLADANYTSQIKIDSMERALQAKKASKEDPKKFKEIWAEYTTEVVENTPSIQVRRAAQLTYDSTGSATYRQMFQEKEIKRKKEYATNIKASAEMLINTHINAINTGNTGLIESSKAEYRAVLDSAVREKVLTSAQRLDAINKLDSRAVLTNAWKTFEQGLEDGNGKAAYDAFNRTFTENKSSVLSIVPSTISKYMGAADAAYSNNRKGEILSSLNTMSVAEVTEFSKYMISDKFKGEPLTATDAKTVATAVLKKVGINSKQMEEDLLEALDAEEANSAGPGFYTAVKDSIEFKNMTQKDIKDLDEKMQISLATEFKKSVAAVQTALDAGVEPNKKDVDNLLSLVKFGNKDEVYKYRVGLAGLNLYKGKKTGMDISSLPLSKQTATVSSINLNGKTEAEIKAVKYVNTMITNKTAKASKDPISLGESEAMYEITDINPNELFNPASTTIDKQLADRVTPATKAGMKYDTVARKVLKPNEVTSIVNTLNSASVQSAHKVMMVKRLIKAFKHADLQDAVFKQIGDKEGTFNMVADLVYHGNDQSAAVVLEGNALIAAGVKVGDKAKLDANIVALLPRHILSNPAKLAYTMRGIEAAYTYQMVTGSNADAATSEVDKAEFSMEALNKARSLVIGVPVNRDGVVSFSPIGATAENFSTFMDRVEGFSTFNRVGSNLLPFVDSPGTDIAIKPAKGMTIDQTRDYLQNATYVRGKEPGTIEFVVGGIQVEDETGKPLSVKYEEGKY